MWNIVQVFTDLQGPLLNQIRKLEGELMTWERQIAELRMLVDFLEQQDRQELEIVMNMPPKEGTG